MNRRFLIILSFILVISMIILPIEANAFAFGGRITSATYTLCCVGFLGCVVPGINLSISSATSFNYLVFVPFVSKPYKWYQFFRSGPEALGTYIPLPIYANCAPSTILKIGTSLL